MPKQVIDRDEAIKILDQGLYGFLGLSSGDQPYVVPLNYVVVGNKLYLHSSSAGKKMFYLKSNPHVCFSVCEVSESVYQKDKACEFGMRYRSVIITGLAREVSESEQKRLALQALVGKYDREGRTKPLASNDCQSVSIIEVEILEISSKANVAADAQKVDK